MAKINGIEGLSVDQLNFELQNGARFIVYQYCISVFVMTFKRSSEIYFVKRDGETFAKGLPFSLLSLVAGWWGIPWGPIWTISTIFRNSRGGLDVTADVVQALSTESAAA